MENLEQIIKLIFRRIPAKPVLAGKIDSGCLRKEDFSTVALAYLKYYSEPEILGMWMHYRDLMNDDRLYHGRITYDSFSASGENGIDVFDVLFYYANHMLVVQDNQILCRYEKLLDWRMTTFSISEDLLTCAFFARNVTPEDMQERGFLWKAVIDHNNIPLQKIMDKGISENHFHLYGSAPMFHISWISLMNNIGSSRSLEALKKYDLDRRNANVRYNASYEEDPLAVQVYQAALIRAYLFLNLLYQEDCEAVRGCADKIPEGCPEEGGKETARKNRNVLYLKKKALLHFDHWEIEEMLNDVGCLYSRLPDIQRMIDEVREFSLHDGEFAETLVDYALNGIENHIESAESSNRIFAGERWFAYTCLHEIYYYRMTPFCKNLFYAYCILKENIRAELIQCNDAVGFVNFQKYERRKSQLYDDAIFQDVAVRMAVHDNLISRNLQSLELRISPRLSAKENYDMVHRLDRIIGEPHERYFYTLHFIKSPDKDLYEDSLTYRHYALRGRIHQQAQGIVNFRECYPRTACRVLGIDAASNEIGCRPEVFAPDFRYLRNHVKMIVEGDLQKQVPQLKVTYHVGEDFLDVVDGLRAIDEAVNFLNMECGDRLGHALALGVDVRGWYHSKHDRILITQQDLLDNIAWLYNRIIEYNIPDMDELKDYLVKKYELFFDRIYGKNINYELVDKILQEARKDFKTWGIANTVHNDRYQFDIFSYYNAWKLRGDDPRLYVSGYCSREDSDIPERRYLLNDKFPKSYGDRYRPEIFLLYYFYHYNPKVRKEGNKRVEVHVKPMFIEGVDEVQKMMQQSIAKKGIAIETNPSSNYQIGTFKDYGQHPIVNWYNLGLVADEKALKNCPQISVSINTDDKGVFATSLENEYGFMARALEEARDEKGGFAYNKAMVYEWLDRVRKMGNMQTFRPPEDEYRKLLRTWEEDVELDNMEELCR